MYTRFFAKAAASENNELAEAKAAPLTTPLEVQDSPSVA